MSKLLFAAGVSLLLAAPVSASPPLQAQPATIQPNSVGPGKSDADQIVCQYQQEIGSRLKGKKVCLTVEQWKEFKAQGREDVERMQEHANTTPSG